jgi:hypothetical protein
MRKVKVHQPYTEALRMLHKGMVRVSIRKK